MEDAGEWAMLVPVLYWNCVVIFGAYLQPIRISMQKPIEGGSSANLFAV